MGDCLKMIKSPRYLRCRYHFYPWVYCHTTIVGSLEVLPLAQISSLGTQRPNLTVLLALHVESRCFSVGLLTFNLFIRSGVIMDALL